MKSESPTASSLPPKPVRVVSLPIAADCAPHSDLTEISDLRRSELRYRRLFETARDGILLIDPVTRKIIDSNPFMAELLGCTRQELQGRELFEIGLLKDRSASDAAFLKLKASGRIRYEDLPLQTRKGQRREVEFVSSLYDEGGENIIQCIVRDITQRKESEPILRKVETELANRTDQLKDSEKERSRLAAIIEYSDDVVVSISVDGIVIGWNQGAEREYGYSAEEAIGRCISFIFPPGHYDEYQKIMRKVRLGETVPSYETVRLSKTGKVMNLAVGIIPIEARDGEVVGASKIGHDISRIKKLETQVIEAQKMAVLGQLAGGVAHDFNNLLSVILGYSELAGNTLDPKDPMSPFISAIRTAAERAAGLTRQLLIFSRNETVQSLVLDLNEAVDCLEGMLQRLIDESIELEVEHGVPLGRMRADPGYIGQLLMNLVINSRDAMPSGGKISIGTRDLTFGESDAKSHPGIDPGAYVVLSVSDTGTGMTEEVKARLFEAFFTTKPKGRGTGLGLATCQSIVAKSKGHIEVSSELGKGTTFTIYFPRVEDPLDSSARLAPAAGMLRGTETVMIVEDDRHVRKMACAVLKHQGFSVLSAANGEEALRVIGEHQGARIRLVITDVVMPQMGGKVMAEWLKSSHPDFKILFTSGYTDETIAFHGLLHPGIAFLAKPYAPAALALKVRELLDVGGE